MDPLKAASVILFRDGEVYLVRRHERSSFMKLAFVFPGGGVEPGDASDELTAIRELFEETGVLLCEGQPSAAHLAQIRQSLASEGRSFAEAMAKEGIRPDPSKLRFWSRWITPSVQPLRFDATFFVAQLPPGQTPRIDGREVIDDRWMSPIAALEAHEGSAIDLPPPQVRMLFELDAARAGDAATWESTIARRQDREVYIIQRFAIIGAEPLPTLLMPWDPDYEAKGTGDANPLPTGHPWAWGPSRFVREGDTWHMRQAPAAPPA